MTTKCCVLAGKDSIVPGAGSGAGRIASDATSEQLVHMLKEHDLANGLPNAAVW